MLRGRTPKPRGTSWPVCFRLLLWQGATSSGNPGRCCSPHSNGKEWAALDEVVKGQILYGVKTGLNEAFIIDRCSRDSLVKSDARSEELIKPILTGDDVRRYEVHFRESYLLYMVHGIDIRRYPAVERHLKPLRGRLEARATEQEWYELQQPSVALIPILENDKIIYPIIGKRLASRLIPEHYLNDKTFMLPTSDHYCWQC